MKFKTRHCVCTCIWECGLLVFKQRVPLGGLSGSSLLSMQVFSEASFLPAPTPQGSFKYNQFVKSYSKISHWNPQADAVILLWADWRLSPLLREHRSLPSGEFPEENEALGKIRGFSVSELKDPGGRGWARSWGCCVLYRVAMIRHSVLRSLSNFRHSLGKWGLKFLLEKPIRWLAMATLARTTQVESLDKPWLLLCCEVCRVWSGPDR